MITEVVCTKRERSVFALRELNFIVLGVKVLSSGASPRQMDSNKELVADDSTDGSNEGHYEEDPEGVVCVREGLCAPT